MTPAPQAHGAGGASTVKTTQGGPSRGGGAVTAIGLPMAGGVVFSACEDGGVHVWSRGEAGEGGAGGGGLGAAPGSPTPEGHAGHMAALRHVDTLRGHSDAVRAGLGDAPLPQTPPLFLKVPLCQSSSRAL